MVVIPRTRMLLAPEPGADELRDTVTPEREPCNAFESIVVRLLTNSSPLTAATAPVRSFFFTVP